MDLQASRPLPSAEPQSTQTVTTEDTNETPSHSPLPNNQRSIAQNGAPNCLLEPLRYALTLARNTLLETQEQQRAQLTPFFPPLLGLGVRFWQVGIEMRPFFNKASLWAYPVYAAGGASFGYWLQGVDDRQTDTLRERKNVLLEKRARKAARDAEQAEA